VSDLVLPGEDETGGAAEALVRRILNWGVDGLGPIQGARAVAEEHLGQHVDPEVAIQRLVATHVRTVGVTGFATGFGGIATFPVTIPTDVAVLYAMSARCAAAVAHLRGYDVHSEEVRSVVLLTLLGSAGAGVAAEVGAQIGTKAAMAALKRVPGRTLIAINKKVGFRLLTKFGQKGVVNLVKFVPVAGGAVGATVNVAAMKTTARYALENFPKT
jgi:hypothetical protein